MNDVIDIIRYNEKGKLLLNFILIIFCIFNIVINNNTYKSVLSNKYKKVDTINQLNKSYKNTSFISLDLSKAKKEDYQIKSKNKKADIYTLNLNNQNVLVLIQENTIVTDSTNVEFINNSLTVQDIKSKFEDNNYYKLVLSNIDLNNDIKINLYKFYILIALIIISICLSFINIIHIIKPKSTSTYKKYIKNNNIEY